MSAAARPVLVTGAAGLVGTHCCRALAADGWRVRALVRDRARGEARLAGSGAELVLGDLRDPGAMDDALRGCGAVLHLAAIAIERGSATYERVNADATLALLAAARTAGAMRFVQMSQNGASSASPHRFLRSKGVAEDAARASGLAWTVLRPSVIFGPEDEFVNALARLVRLSPVVYPLPGGGTARFQPVAVDDVARAAVAVLRRDETVGRAFALGGTAPMSLREMATIVLRAMDARRLLVGVPVALLRPVVAVAQRVIPNPPVTTELLALLGVDNTTPDNDLTAGLGITPMPFAVENLGYLRGIGIGEAVEALFRR
jgi:NADH dehydrogenase